MFLNLKILSNINIFIKYRWSRIIFHLWIKPVRTVRFNEWLRPQVLSLERTMQYIVKNKASICRFGDGEFNIALGTEIGFQHLTDDISIRMREVLDSEDDNVLIAIPDIFNDLKQFSAFSSSWWSEYRLTELYKLKLLLKSDRLYFNSFITRFTSDYMEDQADKLLPYYRCIWNNRDVYIVEGVQTRIGVGNDLMDNASNVYRILAPVKNAYDVYDKIVSSVRTHAPEGSLIIIALGPTATILAYDLAKMGYQALDLGHFDIQYEYHIRGIRNKEPIPGKYVNEAAAAGQTVDDSAITDNRYNKSIIDFLNN